jgi:subtilase family protein
MRPGALGTDLCKTPARRAGAIGHLMRMRLLFIAGLAALSVTAPAAARHNVRPITLREGVAAAPVFVARPRPLLSFRMRWAHERPRRGLAATATFQGGRAVVGLTRAADAAAVARAFRVLPVFLSAGLRALEVSGTQDALHALDAAVGTDARLRYVEPLRERRTLHKRNDPLTTSVDPVTQLPFEWQFAHVGVDRALNADRGSPAILVGVIDTGLGNVPDLTGKIGRAWYFDGQATDAYDTLGHGTFVSSLVGSNNDDGRGMAGFCGACRLLVVKDLALSSFTIATAIRTLTDAGARVINMSFGGPGVSLAETDALNYAISKGVLPVASSGNDGGVVNYPAAFLQPSGGALGYGLAVGASDALDLPAPWSSRGDHLSLLAPGTFGSAPRCDAGVFGALPPVASLFDSDCGKKFGDTVTGARYSYSDGTSFAAPEVAGVAALVWGARPDLLSHQVASILLRSAARPAGSGWTPDHGWGVLDAAAAVELATGKSTADAVTIAEPRFEARVEGGSSATAAAGVTYQDGVAVLKGTATCTADVAGRALAAKEQQFDNGSVRCSWDVPAAAGGGTLTAHVEVEDAESGAVGSRDFEADVLDVLAPRAQALRASGRYGRRVALRFRISEETGEARRLLRVYRGSKAVSSAWSGLEADGPGSVAWKAPRRGTKGPFRFCVSAWDRSGNESDRSCARIVLR